MDYDEIFDYASEHQSDFERGWEEEWDPGDSEFDHALEVFYEAMHDDDRYSDYMKEWICDYCEIMDRDEWDELYG